MMTPPNIEIRLFNSGWVAAWEYAALVADELIGASDGDVVISTPPTALVDLVAELKDCLARRRGKNNGR